VRATNPMLGLTENPMKPNRQTAMETINSRLDHNVRHTSNEWYFPVESRSLTLEALREHSLKLASVLRELGLRKRDRVALMMTNSSSYAITLLALWRLNTVAVPLRPRGNLQTRYADYVRHCDRICDFRLMLFDDSTTGEVLEQAALSNRPHACVGALLATAEQAPLFAGDCAIRDEDIAVLQFSSGSTGAPKGVIVTHGMIMAQLQNLHYNHISSRRGRPVESMASWMPLNHDMGLFMGVLTPLYTGCSHMLASPAFYMRNPPRWFSLMSQRHVDLNFSTNSVLASTLKILRRLYKQDDIDLSGLHLYIGAEKVSPLIVRRCYEVLTPLGFKSQHLHIGYGMAENALGAACTKTESITLQWFRFTGPNCLEPVQKEEQGGLELVAVGGVDWRHEITIRDKAGRPLPDLTLGEIAISSPCVTSGYYSNADKTAEKLIDGRLLTGDIGFIYHDELYFYARQDDMIISAGRNVIPDDIELAVEELPFMRAGGSALIGVDNPQTGCIDLVLLAEVHEHSSRDELTGYRQAIQEAGYESGDIILNRIIFCQRGSVEKTSSGKKRRTVIRKRFINDQINRVEGCNEQHAVV